MELYKYLLLLLFVKSLNGKSLLKEPSNIHDFLNESNQDAESGEPKQMEDLEKSSDNDKKLLLLLKLVKHFDLDDAANTSEDYMTNKLKRSFHIEIYYDIIRLKDGSVLLVPKDKNKNHYFIG